LPRQPTRGSHMLHHVSTDRPKPEHEQDVIDGFSLDEV
jgi:hypothetical protein